MQHRRSHYAASAILLLITVVTLVLGATLISTISAAALAAFVAYAVTLEPPDGQRNQNGTGA